MVTVKRLEEFDCLKSNSNSNLLPSSPIFFSIYIIKFVAFLLYCLKSLLVVAMSCGSDVISDMDPVGVGETSGCHVVAIPYPGRGHINPMMNLCKLLSSNSAAIPIRITFVVTEEWLGFIGSDDKPVNIQLVSIPNVVPSEFVRADDLLGFVKAVLTKMEGPFEELLDGLHPLPTIILADAILPWAVRVGHRRNIPVASVWTMSATLFLLYHHFDLLIKNGHCPIDLSERGEELVDYIPGVSPIRIADLPPIMHENNSDMLQVSNGTFNWMLKSQFLLFTSIYELEAQAMDTLTATFPFPVYPIGSAISHFKLEDNCSITTNHTDLSYLTWLDSQPTSSVLYVSFGSFLSLSSTQMDEVAAGLRESGVGYLWVTRGETSRLQESCGDKGLVVPWCDQMKVLCHSSIGGFWTHCGWNSTLEAVCAGIPMLTLPIVWDQFPNSKLVTEDWNIGWRVKREMGLESLVTGKEIAELVQWFMDLESDVVKEMRRRARELKEVAQRSIAKNGSSVNNLDAFIREISH